MHRHLILLATAVLLCASALAEPLSREDVAIVDGHSIRAHGKAYRLMGFDTPEAASARCPAEREIAERAAKRLKDIADLGGLDLAEVPCACLPGTRGTSFCNGGRLCAVLRSRGRDVGLTLIDEGLARPFHCGTYHCRKRQGWC